MGEDGTEESLGVPSGTFTAIMTIILMMMMIIVVVIIIII
jgi:hypothetical protein